jgi:hypothetical protein
MFLQASIDDSGQSKSGAHITEQSEKVVGEADEVVIVQVSFSIINRYSLDVL